VFRQGIYQDIDSAVTDC